MNGLARDFILRQDIKAVDVKFVLSLIADGVHDENFQCRPNAERIAKLASLPIERVSEIIESCIDVGVLTPGDEPGWFVLANYETYYNRLHADLKQYIAETFPHMKSK